MANRRMFSLKIIDTDHFLDLPATAQVLYFHLAIRADDDGFVAAPKRVMRMIGSSEDDFKLLVAKEYIIPFETGVCVIKHWRVHNYIQKDRHTPTFHKWELFYLNVDADGSYILDGDHNENFQREDKPKALSPARMKRLKVKQESELPYSFDYKLRSEFIGKKCPICGITMGNSEFGGEKNMPTIQHNVPISKGGLHEISNISIVCRSCNSTVQANETPPYNTEEVIEVWERIGNGAGMDTQVRLGKVRVELESYSPLIAAVVDYLNEKCGTDYRTTTKKTRDLITARAKEGFGLHDFHKVIDKKVAAWGDDDKMKIFLRPITLFGTKFESYLNEKKVSTRMVTD
jgi:uncharacterized phage protein (TIGR02220 family)